MSFYYFKGLLVNSFTIIMKKFNKNISKKIFSSFFIFQFIITTAVMPVVAFADEEVKTEESQSVSEEVKDIEVSKEENVSEEATVDTTEEVAKTEDEGGSVIADFVDNLIKGGQTEEPKEDPKDFPACDPSENLIVNGGFENPDVSGAWDIFQDGTNGLGWTVAWQSGSGDNSLANLEIQTSSLWSPQEGNQYAELDSDFDGPSGSLYGEAASTKITQTIDTIPGQTYTVKFYLAGRPGTDYNDNKIIFYIDEVEWDASFSTSAVGASDTYWYLKEYTFTAVKGQTTIGLGDNGDANSVGSFVDNVSVTCGDDTNPPKDGPGSIEICKIIINKEGVVTAGSEFSGETFTIPLTGDELNTNVTFTAELSINSTLGNENQYGMQCKTVGNLPLGQYFYGAEIASGPTDWDVKYTEADMNNPFNQYQSWEYNTVVPNDMGDIFSDGFIDLGSVAEGNDARVIIVNTEKEKIDSCPATLYARINFDSEGVKNWGTGKSAPNVYVGGNTPAHLYAGTEWFPLTNADGSFINDADISSYRDVPGLAVQRMNGKVRVVLYGFNVDQFGRPIGKEMITGSVELSSDQSTRLTNIWTKGNGFVDPVDSYTRVHNVTTNDASNPMDSRGSFVGTIDQYSPLFDNIGISNDLFNFYLVVDTESDGFYGEYNWSVEDCGGGGEEKYNPTITINPETVCLLTSATSFDFMSGVSANDAEDGDLTGSVTNNGNTIVFGTVGSFTVTYSVTDSDSNTVTRTRTIKIADNCGGTGGGDDDEPVINLPEGSCYVEDTVESFDFLNGVTATDSLGATVTLNLTDNVIGEEDVNFTEQGTYNVTYKFTDPLTGEVSVVRTITVDNDCDNGGGGGGGGGGNGGGSSSSGSRRNNRGEVLGATSCIQFTTYNKLGNTGGEIKALQVFLNEYMNSGLTVDGVYGRSTAQAVHEFQAFHWSEIIDPWTPPLSPNTTGWQYKTTRATINAIIDCPEAPLFLEDPQTIFSITEVKDQKSFSTEQMETIYNLLAEAQSGTVLGASDVNSNTTTPNIFDPNYDLLFAGK